MAMLMLMLMAEAAVRSELVLEVKVERPAVAFAECTDSLGEGVPVSVHVEVLPLVVRL